MKKNYQYSDLRQVNRWTCWLLIPPAMLSFLALFYGLYGYSQLEGLQVNRDLALLSPALHQALHIDAILRVSQITFTLLYLTFFCVVWLFLAFRNLVALYDARENNLRNSAGLLTRILLGLFFAMTMLKRLLRESTPQSYSLAHEKWLAPSWSITVISANVCKIVAVFLLTKATTVSDWLTGHYWLFNAYVLYLILFGLTWRLVTRVELLQRDLYQMQGIDAQILGLGTTNYAKRA